MRRRYKPFLIYDDIENDRQFRLFEYFIGPACALAVPLLLELLFYIIDILKGNSKAVYSVSPAEIFLGLILYLFADSVIRMSQEREREISYRKAMDLLRQKMDGTFRVTSLDDDEANDLLGRSFAKSHAIRNTFIGMRGLYGGDSSIDDTVINYYRRVLSKKGSVWEDIVGVGDYFDGRFAAIWDDRKSLRGEHRISVLASNTPILNFILCGPRNKEFTEVYFGWIRAPSLEIFYSKDLRVIRMFDKYFDMLSSRPARIIDNDFVNYATIEASQEASHKNGALESLFRRFSRPKSNEAISSEGYDEFPWIEAMFGKWISIEGKVDEAEKIQEYTIIHITCSEEIRISGESFDINNKGKSSFKSNSVSILDRAIMYRYKLGAAEGIGIYKLDTRNNCIRGYFVRDSAEKSEIIRAVKLNDDSQTERQRCLSKIMKIPSEGIEY